MISNEHKSNTPKEEEEKEDEQEEKVDKNSKDFLQFVAFAMKMRLSFSQIEEFGKFLQNAYKEEKLKFLSSCTFDERLLSKIAQGVFKNLFEENLKEKL